MSALTHPDDLIRRLRNDRRRCFVIFGRPGSGKTRLARAMAVRYDGQYLDLLSRFLSDPALCAALDTFTPQHLREYLASIATRSLVLVDELDFLWSCWDARARQQFLSLIMRWDKPAFFGLFLPASPEIEAFRIVDQDGLPRKYLINELEAVD